MNAQLLIDSIVRQTTVLIAQLATSGGVRAPLAHVANQVFLELSMELNNQGISRKVSAGMFGMALRSYLRRIQRLSESSTERGRSLSLAVLDFLSDARAVTRAEVLLRFSRDDPALVRAVLYDMTESGLLFRSGSGEATSYRAASDADLSRMRRASESPPDELVWAIIYRHGPISEEALAKLAGGGDDLGEALERLTASGRVQRDAGSDGSVFSASEFVVPLGSPVGWEASVFDHFQAVVKTICRRLSSDAASARSEETGGSTYTFDVWPGHPLEERVRGLLREARKALGALRTEVEEHNQRSGLPADYDQVTFYCGQSVIGQEEGERDV